MLYVLLAAQPLMGLTASMLYGSRIVVFGGIEVPSFLAEIEPLARQIRSQFGWWPTSLLEPGIQFQCTGARVCGRP